MFVDTFKGEVAKLTSRQADWDRDLRDRLTAIEAELANLSANMLSRVLSAALIKLFQDREAEKAPRETPLAYAAPGPVAQIMPQPVLQLRFAAEVGAQRETLDDDTVRAEACEVLDPSIESVTIYPDGANGPEAEVVANVADLAWAINDNAPGGRPVRFYGGGCGGRI